MKRIRYGVAMSLDGYIAGPNGEADWIVSDPEVNFAKIWAQFDTLLMGRRTYDAAKARLGEAALQGVKTIVVSRTLTTCRPPEGDDLLRFESRLDRRTACAERQRYLAVWWRRTVSLYAGNGGGGQG